MRALYGEWSAAARRLREAETNDRERVRREDMLRFQLDDIALCLDTSRQREAKQQYEYDVAAQALPLARAERAAIDALTEEELQTYLALSRKLLEQLRRTTAGL